MTAEIYAEPISASSGNLRFVVSFTDRQNAFIVIRRPPRRMTGPPMISDEDVAPGGVAFFAPSPTPNKRKIESGESAGVRRPISATDKGERSRIGAKSAEKGYFARYTKISTTGLAGGKGFSGCPRFTVRKLVFGKPARAHPRNRGSDVWDIPNYSGGVLGSDTERRMAPVSPSPSGAAKKNAEELAIKGYMPGGRSICDVIKRGMAAVHDPGP